MNRDLTDVAHAISKGDYDTAIAMIESLKDQGVEGVGVCFDRGLAYFGRGLSSHAVAGDFGHAAHAFEECLRLNPHDSEASTMLLEVRKRVASAHTTSTGQPDLVAALPVWRSLVVALPGDAWCGLGLFFSAVLAVGLAIRTRVSGGVRLAVVTSTIAAFFLAVLFSVLSVSSWDFQSNLHEAVVVSPSARAARNESAKVVEFREGERVDVLELRASSAMVRSSDGEGWLPLSALRMLSPYRP